MISFKKLPPAYLKLSMRALSGLSIAVVAAIAGALLIGVSGWFITATALTGLGMLSLQSYNLFIPSAVIRLLAMSKPPLKYYEKLFNHQLTFRLAAQTRTWLFRGIFSADKRKLVKFRNIDFTAKITTDVNQMDTLLTGLMVPWIVNLVIFLIAAIYFLLFLPALGILLMVIYLICGIIIPFLALRKGLKAREQNQLHQQLESHLSDQIVGYKELLSFGLFTRYGEISRSLISRLTQAGKNAMVEKSSFSFLQTLSLEAGLITAIVILGLMKGLNDGPGMVMAILVFITLSESILPLAGLCFDQGKTGWAMQSLNGLTAGRSAESAAQFPVNEKAGHIAIANLTFGYKKRLLFQDLSINFPAATTTLINGRNGSGKSTLMDLVYGFITPRCGEIIVNGDPLPPERVKSTNMSYLEQEPALFNVSILENISLAKPGSSYEEVIVAAMAAGLKTLIELLPEGLLYIVEEGGTNLSGGQKRMIALARVILKDPLIIILDEPTEGMDKQAEQNFIELVNNWHKRKTIIIITHKKLSGLTIDRSYTLLDSNIKVT